jgi:hypothetical protein
MGADAFELVKAFDGWGEALRGKASAKNEVLGLVGVAALGLDVPDACSVVPLSSLNVDVKAIF